MSKLVKEKLFNDSVHGFILIHPLCVRIIDTPQFQRLRNIKQLGIVGFVYPGSSHNRLEHSLGVCHLSKILMNALLKNSSIELHITEEESLCVQIAALCHDLGHGPFSHMWEKLLKSYDIHWKHETHSIVVLRHLIESNQLTQEFSRYGLSDIHLDLISELIKGDGSILPAEKSFLYQIVSNNANGIDVDKWDYIVRDSSRLHLNARFDYARLLNFCQVMYENDGRTVVAYDKKELPTLCNMYNNRYDLHICAYQHKVVKNLELMFIDVFREANDVLYHNIEFGSNHLYRLSLTDLHNEGRVKCFVRATDNILSDIENSNCNMMQHAQFILHRIYTRNLYSHIGTYDLCQMSGDELAHLKETNIKNPLLDNIGAVFDNIEFRVSFLWYDVAQAGLKDPSRLYLYDNDKNADSIVSHQLDQEKMPTSLCSQIRRQVFLFSTEPVSAEQEKQITKHVSSFLIHLLNQYYLL